MIAVALAGLLLGAGRGRLVHGDVHGLVDQHHTTQPVRAEQLQVGVAGARADRPADQRHVVEPQGVDDFAHVRRVAGGAVAPGGALRAPAAARVRGDHVEPTAERRQVPVPPDVAQAAAMDEHHRLAGAGFVEVQAHAVVRAHVSRCPRHEVPSAGARDKLRAT